MNGKILPKSKIKNWKWCDFEGLPSIVSIFARPLHLSNKKQMCRATHTKGFGEGGRWPQITIILRKKVWIEILIKDLCVHIWFIPRFGAIILGMIVIFPTSSYGWSSCNLYKIISKRTLSKNYLIRQVFHKLIYNNNPWHNPSP